MFRLASDMLKLRKAVPDDIPLILSFIRELAEYERAPKAVSCTEKDLHRDGFGPSPKFRVIIAEWNGEPAGMASSFTTTLRGKDDLESSSKICSCDPSSEA